MNDINGIFTEEFRPTKLEHIVLPNRISSMFAEADTLNQHYLFYSGIPGSGKTTLCKILGSRYTNDKSDVLYINVSDESGVDTIRHKIKNFASSMSVFANEYQPKIIILDEIDGASDQFYKALRGVIEQFSKNVRFLATCNYINKIPEAMQSRFLCVKFEPENKEEESEILKGLIKRTLGICKLANIKIEPIVAVELVKKTFPDMRKVLNKIQSFHVSGVTSVTMEDIEKTSYAFVDLFNLCISEPNPTKNYIEIMDAYRGKADDIIMSLGSEFPGWLFENKPDIGTEIMDVVSVVNDASYKRKFVIDDMINLLDCIFKIQRVFNK